MKRVPIKRTVGLKRTGKPRAKNAQGNEGYLATARAYLLRNQICHVCLEQRYGGECRFSEQVHHIGGRLGARLLDTRLFLATCQAHHTVNAGSIHESPANAKLRGWLISQSMSHADQLELNLAQRGHLAYVRQEYDNRNDSSASLMECE